MALRAAIGTTTLDNLLSDKDTISRQITESLSQRAADFGVTICSVGLRDIILPGDMKTLMNQVIEAEKQAQANLIRRREETAAARSQANTAKLLHDNPTLLRMREMEMLSEVLTGANTTFIVGKEPMVDQLHGMLRNRIEND